MPSTSTPKATTGPARSAEAVLAGPTDWGAMAPCNLLGSALLSPSVQYRGRCGPGPDHHIDDDTFAKADTLTAHQSTSVGSLITAVIRPMVDRDDADQIALSTALRQLDEGVPLGEQPLPDRGSLHERCADLHG